MTATTWKSQRHREWVRVNADGRIVARVSENCGEYAAHVDGTYLGNYVDLEAAQRACERSSRQLEPTR